MMPTFPRTHRFFLILLSTISPLLLTAALVLFYPALPSSIPDSSPTPTTSPQAARLKAGKPGTSRGLPYIHNYSRKEYRNQSQNWAFIQDKRGIIFMANHGGLMEYDGVSWKEISIPNKSVRSLAIDDKGTLFIGGLNDFGYLAEDSTGSLQYISLTGILDKRYSNYGYVWRCFSCRDGIYFFTSQFLFLLEPDSKPGMGKQQGQRNIKVWETKNRCAAPFLCGNQLVSRENGLGLSVFVLQEGHFSPLPGTEMFAHIPVPMMVPYTPGTRGTRGTRGAPGSFLIGTNTGGLYLYDGKQALPFPTGADAYLKENQLNCGIRLSSSPGTFALGTRSGGLVIIDENGRLKHILSSASGLLDDNVNDIYEDHSGNLWLALNKGAAFIETASPFSFFYEQSGYHGIPLAITNHGPADTLFLGTTTGIFYLDRREKFQLLSIPGNANYCNSFLSSGDLLLVASESGIDAFQTKAGPGESPLQVQASQKITKRQAYALTRSRQDKNRCWAGTKQGLLSFYYKENRWQVEKPEDFSGIPHEIRTIAEDRDGSLWLGTLTAGAWKVEFPRPGAIDKAEARHFDSSTTGLPQEVHVFWAAGQVMFAFDRSGLFRFDEKKQTFVPDYTLGNEFAGTPGGPNGADVYRIEEDNSKNIWLQYNGVKARAIPQPDGSYVIDKRPFLRLQIGHAASIYADPDGHATWFAGVDGLIHYDWNIKKNIDTRYLTLIRSVSVNGREVYGGYRGYRGYPSSGLKGTSFPSFEYKDRNMRFEYAAAFYEAPNETVYRCRLVGCDEGWSAWNKETRKDYTNIEPGVKTFRVQARNIYGTTGEEDIFHFRIVAPWYRSWWAYITYALLLLSGLVLTMFLVVRWRSRKLVEEKQHLEKIISERTTEIAEKNNLLMEQAQQLKELDRVKSRFFANISHEFRTPLTLILGPIEQMHACPVKDEGGRSCSRSLRLMEHNAQRLLGLINRLLELSKFDSGKATLQAAEYDIAAFIRGITAAFENVARQQQLDLQFQGPTQPIPVYFDPIKLEEVTCNLLSNAVKFTPPQGKITVTVTAVSLPLVPSNDEDKQKFFGESRGAVLQKSPPGQRRQENNYPAKDYVQITVRDTGPGIPVDELAHIFDRFFQAHTTREHHLEGSGIGLAICKEIVELHHGTISVEVPAEEGTGAEGTAAAGGIEFIIRLPLGREHLKDEEIVNHEHKHEPIPRYQPRQQLQQPVVRPDAAYRDGPGYEAEEENENRPASQEKENQCAADIYDMDIDHMANDQDNSMYKPLILVVEDNAGMREYIRGAVEKEGEFRVEEAVDGKAGLEKARSLFPDLVISDIMMPVMDGYALCRELKKDRETGHIPVILLTAKAADDDILEGLGTGADDYITKPFNTQILIARIRNLVELRRQLQLAWQREMNLQPTVVKMSAGDREFIKDLRKVMDQHMGDPGFDVETLGNKLYMSHTSLYRKIQALTGETPTLFIRSYRLKRAAELLKKKAGAVIDIAFDVGFSSTAYFTKCFKEKFHRLPSEYGSGQDEG